MTTTFQLPAEDLDVSILKSIKEAFTGRDIEIIISDENAANNAAILLTRIKNLRENKDTIDFTQEDFFRIYKRKIADASNKI